MTLNIFLNSYSRNIPVRRCMMKDVFLNKLQNIVAKTFLSPKSVF